MDDARFDTLTRSLTRAASSRRRLLTVVAGLAWTRLGVGTATAQEAETHYGCIHFKRRCKRASQCCSGVCKGKKGRKTCRAHNVGTCTLAKDFCATNTVNACNPDDPETACLHTTGNAPFCASAHATDPLPACQPCLRDLDCVGLGYPPGSACVVYEGEFCPPELNCPATSGRVCYHPGI